MRIAVCNLKGGVGKTTSAVYLAAGLHRAGRTLDQGAAPVSPTKRPSAVRGGVQRGLDAGLAAPQSAAPAAPATAPADEPKARVTLNLPAPLYRDIERWAIDAAGALGVPRVSVQDALRGMIRAAVADQVVTGVVLDLLRRDHG